MSAVWEGGKKRQGCFSSVPPISFKSSYGDKRISLPTENYTRRGNILCLSSFAAQEWTLDESKNIRGGLLVNVLASGV